MLDRYDHNLLLDYLEGELDAGQRAQLEAALKDDPELAGLLDAIAGDRELLRSMPRQEVPAELSHDLTQVLERRMLMDESLGEAGPIPIARGRALPTEQVQRGSGWRRVAGLTGLAASVAIAAGLVVYLLPNDPLQNTANRLAQTPGDGAGAGTDEHLVAEDIEGGAHAEDNATTGRALAATLERDDTLNQFARTLGADPTPAPAAGATAGRIDPASDPERIARVEENLTDAAAITPEPADAPAIRRDELARVSAEHNAVGIASIQPQMQLVLFTEEPRLSREQLVAHCVANGIPIVKGDANLNGRKRKDQVIANQAQRAGDDPGPDAQSDDLPADGNYALLINDTQLDNLVYSFNNNDVIDTEALGQRGAIATQAAVVEQLPANNAPDQLAEHAPGQDAPQPGGFDLKDAVSNTVPYEAPKANNNPNPAIQLYLPEDLGSSYANTRNRDNFQYEQRRNAYNTQALNNIAPDKLALDKEEAEPAEKRDASLVAEATQPADPIADQDLSDPLAKDRSTIGTAEADHLPNKLAERIAQPTPAQPLLDPLRSNWLAPHLPLSETTLILNWRLDTAAQPARLVPIQIMTAPAEAVQSLRRLQQVQQAAEQFKREQAPTQDLAAEAQPNADPADESESDAQAADEADEADALEEDDTIDKGEGSDEAEEAR